MSNLNLDLKRELEEKLETIEKYNYNMPVFCKRHSFIVKEILEDGKVIYSAENPSDGYKRMSFIDTVKNIQEDYFSLDFGG